MHIFVHSLTLVVHYISYCKICNSSVKRLKVQHLYTATCRETWTAAVYNWKWCTDRH